jgi:hypothetical protein
MDGTHSENKRCRIAKGARKRKSRCVAFMHQGVIAPVFAGAEQRWPRVGEIFAPQGRKRTTFAVCDAATFYLDIDVETACPGDAKIHLHPTTAVPASVPDRRV